MTVVIWDYLLGTCECRNLLLCTWVVFNLAVFYFSTHKFHHSISHTQGTTECKHMYNNLTYFFYNKCNLQWMNKTRRAALLSAHASEILDKLDCLKTRLHACRHVITIRIVDIWSSDIWSRIEENVSRWYQSHVNTRHKVLDLFGSLRGVIALHPVLMYYAIEICSSLFLLGFLRVFQILSGDLLRSFWCGSTLSIYSQVTDS
jgi:hypothetical protein